MFNYKWVSLSTSQTWRNSCQGATSPFVQKCKGIIWEQNVTSAGESIAHLSQCNHHNLTSPCLSLRVAICTYKSSSSWWKSIIIMISFFKDFPSYLLHLYFFQVPLLLTGTTCTIFWCSHFKGDEFSPNPWYDTKLRALIRRLWKWAPLRLFKMVLQPFQKPKFCICVRTHKFKNATLFVPLINLINGNKQRWK